MWWNPRNGFDRAKALFGVALVQCVPACLRNCFRDMLSNCAHTLGCREALLGAEVRLCMDDSDNIEDWAEARILAVGTNEDHPTEGRFSHKLPYDGSV
eukprot:COSAG02_NODE_1275_length_13506_cov_8.845603_7_plen_98_part_00